MQKFLVFVFVGLGLVNVECFHRKNSCKNTLSYMFIDFSNQCYYNPDVFANMDEILQRRVGKYEKYYVTTEDGYILSLYRIPNGNPDKTAILQHPLITDGKIWVLGKDALAFYLHELKYDVWILNNRGTPDSLKHVSLSSNDKKYWDFSFHEEGIYDTSAVVNFVTNKTRSDSILYVSHSMGTAIGNVYASMRPEEAKSAIKMFVHAAPSGYFQKIGRPYFWKPFVFLVSRPVINISIHGGVLNTRLIELIKLLLVLNPFKYLVRLFVGFLFGWTPDNFDSELLNLVLSQSFQPFSFKTVQHFNQIINGDGIFRMYDYGKDKNKLVYNSEIPPEYPLEKIQTPIYLMAAKEDVFTKDVETMYGRIPEKYRVGLHIVPYTNHIDYLVSKDRRKKVNENIIDVVNKFK